MISQKRFYAILWIVLVCTFQINGENLDSEMDGKIDVDLHTHGLLEINEAADECYCGNYSTNCEYQNGLKVCTCKEGYVPGINEVCTEMCSESKKCANGGTCFEGICLCPPRTKGTFCEQFDISCWRPDYYEPYAGVRGLYCCCLKNSTAQCKYDVKKYNLYCECPKKGDVYEDLSNSCKECNCGKPETWTKCDFYGGVKTCFCKKDYEFNKKTKQCDYCNCGENSTKCEYSWSGDIKCTCLKGYQQYKSECLECDCGENGACEIRDGKSICHCNPKFQDFNGVCKECNCGKYGKCVYDNAGNKERCECDTGYSENSVGECVYCYCGDNSVCNFTTDNKKNCSCPYGFRDVNGFCTDINECDEGTGYCPEKEKCRNLPGGYLCTCADGYIHTPNGCEDENECAFVNPCKNQGTDCVNLPGSYECRCQSGYYSRGGHKDGLECQKSTAANVGYGMLATLFSILVVTLSFIVYRKYRGTADPPLISGT